jgi:hypothetical protein
MKRSPLGPGKTSLQRGSTFAPRPTSLKRARRPPRSPSEIEAAAAWAKGVKAKPCALCGAKGVDAHHIITKQKLREVAAADGLDVQSLLWDHRNRLALCRRHHEAHHSRMHPVPWTVLEQHAPKVFQFAREIGVLPWLERNYPAAGA